MNRKKWLTFANVAALLALVLALGNGVVFAGGGTSNGRIVGYARVRANGTVIGNRSLNVTSSNVTLESTSAFCFRDLPFNFKGAQVTMDYGATGVAPLEASFALGNPWGDCDGADVQAEVATSDGTSFGPEPFFIVFYR